VLAGILFALDAGRPAHLEAAHRALSSLSFDEQLAVGVTTIRHGECRLATYRQYEDTFSVICRAIDPSPVPSFGGVAEGDRAARLEAARAGIDTGAGTAGLHQVIDDLVEASIPERYKMASSSLAIDWTDHESWSRPRTKEDPQPANDPDASWGHAKRNAPGAKDCLFFGYYAQVATMVHDEAGPVVPELVRRIAVAPPRLDPAKVMATTLVRAKRSGLVLGDVLADCGYSNRHPANFAAPLRAAGARLVFDLHPDDRGPRGTFEGAILANGQLYCPATPGALLGLGPLKRGASASETAAHDARSAELARYRLPALTAPDHDGYQRVICPAAAGRLRCPLRPASMSLSGEHPSILTPPASLPRCCVQQTITLPPEVNEKTRQAHDYPSAAHRRSYGRRTSSERCFASLCDPSAGGLRRGWCRLFGLAKNSLMYALAVVVRNVRILDSFERARADEARRAATGLAPRRRRRRRYGPEVPAPPEPGAAKEPHEPG
jgi:hypothetical protein